HYTTGQRLGKQPRRSFAVQNSSRTCKQGPMLADLIQSEIQELIEQRKFAELKEVLAEWHPADLAEAIVEFPIEQQVVIFRMLPQALAADVFEYLDVDAQASLLKAL